MVLRAWCCRLLEGFWLVLITQANHVTMNYDYDWKSKDFLTAQTTTTCNLQPSFFLDWFSGHINYHAEHQ